MSSRIGYLLPDKQNIKSIHCKGIEHHKPETLYSCYNTSKKVHDLVKCGTISNLGTTIQDSKLALNNKCFDSSIVHDKDKINNYTDRGFRKFYFQDFYLWYDGSWYALDTVMYDKFMSMKIDKNGRRRWTGKTIKINE